MPPIFWIGLGIAGFIFLVGVDLRRPLEHGQPPRRRADGPLPRRHARLPAARHRPRHQLPPARRTGIIDVLWVLDRRDPTNGDEQMASATSIPAVTLHDGVEIPQLGFGVFQVPPEETQQAVEEALADRLPPHRHRRRLPQRGGGGGGDRRRRPRRARRSSSPPSSGTPSRATTRPCAPARRASSGSGMDHVDLYLIHWPVPTEDRYLDTWRAFERICGRGQIALDRRLQLPRRGPRAARSARPRRCRRSTRSSCTRTCSRPSCARWHAEHGVATEAWSPLAQGAAARATRRSRRSPPTTRRRRRRSSSAGTCSSATS